MAAAMVLHHMAVPMLSPGSYSCAHLSPPFLGARGRARKKKDIVKCHHPRSVLQIKTQEKHDHSAIFIPKEISKNCLIMLHPIPAQSSALPHRCVTASSFSPGLKARRQSYSLRNLYLSSLKCLAYPTPVWACSSVPRISCKVPGRFKVLLNSRVVPWITSFYRNGVSASPTSCNSEDSGFGGGS